MEDANINHISESQYLEVDEDGFVMIPESEIKTNDLLNVLSEELIDNCDDESIESQSLSPPWATLGRILAILPAI